MTSRDVLNDVNALLEQLMQAELVVDANAAIQVPIAGGVLITWSNRGGDLVSRSKRPTMRDYFNVIERRNYNFLLRDGSVLQIEYVFARGTLRGHRLVFFPCPAEITIDEPREDVDLSEAIREQILRAVESLATEPPSFPVDAELGDEDDEGKADDVFATPADALMRTPLRFDFDVASAGAGHPASHVHLMHSDCRIPVFGPLTVRDFAMLVFSQFLPDLTRSALPVDELPRRRLNRTVQDAERLTIYLDRLHELGEQAQP